eukprot:280026-Amphidinium_carterae.1
MENCCESSKGFSLSDSKHHVSRVSATSGSHGSWHSRETRDGWIESYHYFTIEVGGRLAGRA